MPELITRRAMPSDWADFPPNYRPFLVEDLDCERLLEDTDGTVHQRRRRTRVVLYFTADGDLDKKVYDLGPATGKDAVSFPCAGAVEMAQLWELLEWYEGKMAEREAREAEVKPVRTQAFLDFLRRRQEENDALLAGRSSFGEYQRTQRES